MDDKELDNDKFDDLDSGNDAAPESGSEGSAPPSPDQSGEKSGSEKRINDLMSARDQATARANAAEARLAELEGKKTPASDGKTKNDAAPASAADQWAALLRDQARDQLFASDPRLAEYGIEKSLITGETPEEMKAALETQIKVVDSIETKARNKALAEHGLEPEVRGGSGEKPIDYASMSKEDFEKAVARAGRR